MRGVTGVYQPGIDPASIKNDEKSFGSTLTKTDYDTLFNQMINSEH